MAVGEETTKLSQTITNARKKLENRNANHKLGEENTKMGVITPILAALGWDTEDWNEVSHEYRYRGGNSNPVDYALLLKNTPELFVEAKGYGENIDDVKWAEQCISYASSAGVRWIVLTDGMSWKLYDTARVVPVEEKLFKETKLSDADAPEFFNLLTKASVSKNMLDFIGDTEKVDNAVLEALNGLFGSSKPSQSLVNLVYKTVEEQSRRAGEFDKGKIREALARCEGRFSFPPATMIDLEKMAKTGSTVKAKENIVSNDSDDDSSGEQEKIIEQTVAKVYPIPTPEVREELWNFMSKHLPEGRLSQTFALLKENKEITASEVTQQGASGNNNAAHIQLLTFKTLFGEKYPGGKSLPQMIASSINGQILKVNAQLEPQEKLSQQTLTYVENVYTTLKE